MDQLKANQLFPEQLLSSLVFSVVITDLEGRFLYVNPLFQYKFSHLAPDLKLMHFADTVYADDIKLCNEAARECIKNPEKHVTVTVRKATDTEDFFWTTWEVTVLKNEMGYGVGIVSIGHDVTTTERVQDKVKELSQQLANNRKPPLQALINHIPGVVYRCMLDEKLTVDYFSDAVKELTGHDVNTLTTNRKEGFNRLIHKDDVGLVEQTIQHAILNKHHFEIEYRIINKNGELKWVFERGGVTHDVAENQHFVDGSIFDITSRKKIEAALERTEDEVKRLALVAHNTTNSVIIADIDENIIWVNEGFTRIAEYSFDEAIGHQIGFNLDHPHADQQSLMRLKKALSTQQSIKEEFLSYTKSGALIWLEIDCQPLYDEENRHIGYMSIENDITRRKQSQLEQQDLLERLTLATDSAQIGIWEIDLADEQIIWDEKMFEMYGYEKNTPFSPEKIWNMALHPEDQDMMSRIFARLIEGQREIDSAVYRITTPNGRIRHIEAHAIAKKGTDGKVLRLIGTNRNITDDVVVQEKLKSQNKALRDIAFIQSHEVRRPLANILGVIEVLNQTESLENKEIFDHLIESANELDMQIKSIVNKTNSLDGLIVS